MQFSSRNALRITVIKVVLRMHSFVHGFSNSFNCNNDFYVNDYVDHYFIVLIFNIGFRVKAILKNNFRIRNTKTPFCGFVISSHGNAITAITVVFLVRSI
jgi:hypothetical protein